MADSKVIKESHLTSRRKTQESTRGPERRSRKAERLIFSEEKNEHRSRRRGFDKEVCMGSFDGEGRRVLQGEADESGNLTFRKARMKKGQQRAASSNENRVCGKKV